MPTRKQTADALLQVFEARLAELKTMQAREAKLRLQLSEAQTNLAAQHASLVKVYGPELLNGVLDTESTPLVENETSALSPAKKAAATKRRKKAGKNKVSKKRRKASGLMPIAKLAELAVPIIKKCGQRGMKFRNSDVRQGLLDAKVAEDEASSGRISIMMFTNIDGLDCKKELHNNRERNVYTISGTVAVREKAKKSASSSTKKTREKTSARSRRPKQKRGMKAEVLEILQSSPHLLDSAAVINRLAENGMVGFSENAPYSALSQLKREGLIKKIGDEWVCVK